MSNQVEQIRAEVERRIKSWAAGVKYEGDAGDCQSRVTELTDLKKFIDSLPTKENPLLVPESKETPIEVCGKKVVVRYARTQEEACASCAFCSRKECHDLDCNMRDIIGESVSRYAYFVDAEQPEVASPLRDETGRLYEHIDTPITRYSEEHFDYDSEWDSLTPKGGRLFGPADLEAAILFGYNLNPKHK